MGWQEEQAAARAREQQRQNYQRAESARQAESIRRENETRSREQRQRTNAEFAANNSRRDAERQARDRAASDKAHAERMRQIQQAGQNTWSSSTTEAVRRGKNEDVSYGRGTSSNGGKSKGGGLLLVLLIIGGIVLAAGRSKTSSGPNAPAPIENGTQASSASADPITSTAPAASPSIDQTQPSDATWKDSPGQPSASGEEATIAIDDVNSSIHAPASSSTLPDDGASQRNNNSLAASAPAPLEPVERYGASYPVADCERDPQGLSWWSSAFSLTDR